jgi:DNA-binding CsgD family transcriptional regulator
MKDRPELVDPKLKALFDQMPGCWGCKDNNSVFLYANKQYSEIIGIGEKHHVSIIGRTDFDMPCDTVNCAELFRKQDKTVMLSEKRMRILDIHPFAGKEWRAYVFTKTPLYNDLRNVVGTIFHGIDITNTSMLEIGSLLSRMTEDVHNDLLGSQNSYLISHHFNAIKLTDREAECLFYLLRGKTAKQIARYLGISHRTIEEYFEKLRIKFDASNKYELIDKAIQVGFLNTIPESLFKTQLSVTLRDD